MALQGFTCVYSAMLLHVFPFACVIKVWLCKQYHQEIKLSFYNAFI